MGLSAGAVVIQHDGVKGDFDGTTKFGVSGHPYTVRTIAWVRNNNDAIGVNLFVRIGEHKVSLAGFPKVGTAVKQILVTENMLLMAPQSIGVETTGQPVGDEQYIEITMAEVAVP